MNIFFYAQAGSTEGDSLVDEIAPLVPREKLEVFETAHDLAARLLKQMDDSSVAILVSPKNEDLRTLISMRNSIRGTRFLLILSDEKNETISLAHRLFPSFISYTDRGTAEVVSVVLRLMAVL